MKADDLTEACIEAPHASIVIEIGDGILVSTTDYYFDTNKRGEDVIVIRAKRKISK